MNRAELAERRRRYQRDLAIVLQGIREALARHPDGIPADVFLERAAADVVEFAGEAVEFGGALLADQTKEWP